MRFLRQIVVLTSGKGTTLQNLFAYDGTFFTIKGVVCSRSEDKAHNNIYLACRNRRIPIVHAQNTKEVDDLIKDWKPTLVVMAGYLKKWTPTPGYKNRTLNIHPSLLPKYGGQGFYGDKIHESVLENKETSSGCTVHLVDENYNTGKILAQVSVPVYQNDTVQDLKGRVLAQEYNLYPRVIRTYIEQLI